MTLQESASPSDRAELLLSWDRLGFRLMFFGGLGILWIIQGRLFNQPWPDLIRGELGGVLPWAFVAPIILAINRRVRMERVGLARYLGAHALGMVAVFIPFWFMRLAVFSLWTGIAQGWALTHFKMLIPTLPKVLGLFVEVPFFYLIILLGAEAMRQAQARKEEELLAGRVAGQLAEARLALLQRQLHPHFLFNALQAISTLLHRDPMTADALLVRLSTLLRAMLDTASGQTLSLRTELDLTRKYLEIEQVRFADRLRVEWDVDASLLDLQVPSLIVLPLVENAIRHGLSPKVGPGCLKISAQVDGAALTLRVSDDGLGTTLPLHLGVGIGNTQARLEAMYGGRANLDVEAPPQGGFAATLHLPLSEA